MINNRIILIIKWFLNIPFKKINVAYNPVNIEPKEGIHG